MLWVIAGDDHAQIIIYTGMYHNNSRGWQLIFNVTQRLLDNLPCVMAMELSVLVEVSRQDLVFTPRSKYNIKRIVAYNIACIPIIIVDIIIITIGSLATCVVYFWCLGLYIVYHCL